MPAKKTPSKSTKTTSRSRGAAAVAGETNGTTPRRGRMRELVIVESPAKARTISGILGSGFEVTASVGHVRDLPKSKLGVDVDNEFLPSYIVPKEKKDVVAKIKEA